jgi:hypothetical protein
VTLPDGPGLPSSDHLTSSRAVGNSASDRARPVSKPRTPAHLSHSPSRDFVHVALRINIGPQILCSRGLLIPFSLSGTATSSAHKVRSTFGKFPYPNLHLRTLRPPLHTSTSHTTTRTPQLPRLN